MFVRTSHFLLFLSCHSAIGQNQLPSDSFEAAVARTNKSGEIRMAVDFQPGGRFSATNVPLRILIALAYRVRPEAVTGGPGWLGADRFDIVAKAAQTTPPDGIRRMLQTLLAERFKLQLHSEKKEMPAYALVPGKSGTRLQPSEAELLTNQRCHAGAPIPGRQHLVCEHMTLAMFADTLQEIAPRDIDVPVRDQTGTPGTYKFDLAWTPAVRSATTDAPDLSGGPTLFEALESQLGLKLERKKLLLQVIVIDSVERVPSEN